MPTKPNKENIQKWVDALRSGKYQQTQGYLHRTTADHFEEFPLGFCCLGVACDISKLGKWQKHPSDYQPAYKCRNTPASKRGLYNLPQAVADWLGLEASPVVTYNRRPRRLASLNDDGVDFETIAALIERDYLK